jgi:DNA-binding IclR family transcriptional regulator
MSYDAICWALTTGTEPTARLVLLALARSAPGLERPQTATPFPVPIPLLAKRTGLAERSVRRALRDLEAAGLILTTYKRETYGLNAFQLVPGELPPAPTDSISFAGECAP